MPASAARPLLDTHQLDGVFALFAQDTMVPWKHPTVRLDTYSGAPVDFAAFEIDPAEVLIAGSSRFRPIDTSRVKPVTKWKFTPPTGYKFESNDVELPLGSREGFFVIEARRGDAAQQTWVNVSRIGLVSKEAPDGFVLYGADLGTGQPLHGMRVQFLASGHFVTGKTDNEGIVHGVAGTRFALAEWGSSRAFVSIAAQPPLPAGIVGVRADRAVVRAGDSVRVVGFARKREGKSLRPMTGEVRLSALVAGRSVASSTLTLTPSGGFTGSLDIPANTPAGALSVLASSGGASGGTTVRVDASGAISLSAAATCGTICPANGSITIRFAARNANIAAQNQTVSVRIVRSPHVIPSDTSDAASLWGTTVVYDGSVVTSTDGTATITLPGPQDGLSSTYGVVASAQNATATARIVAANSSTVLSIVPEDASIDVGTSATFDVHGFDAIGGRAAAGREVKVVLTKGPYVKDQTITLDGDGRGRAVFTAPQLGTNIATAAYDDGNGLDATALTVAPQALGARSSRRSGEITLTLDKDRYKLGDRVNVTANLTGAVGSAFFTVEGARVADQRVIGLSGGRASASLSLENASGSVRIGVAFVRDGALYVSDVPVAIDGPGYPRVTVLTADRASYTPGSTAHISINDGASAGASLLAIRVTDGQPGAGSAFDDAPAILAAGGTTTQNAAAPERSWHAYVAPSGSKAQDIFGADRVRSGTSRDAELAVAGSRAVVWRVDASDRGTFDVALPSERGSYVLSVLKISNDGDVGAASLPLSVQ